MLSVPPLLVSLIVLGVVGPLIWLTRPHLFRHFGWLAALPPALVTGWLIAQLDPVSHGVFLAEHYAWASQLGLELSLRLDGLALFFGLIVAGVGAVVALYSGYYFEGDERLGYFYALLFLFMTSMLGIVWSDNLLTLFVFWEGTSITSYLLIAFDHDDKAAVTGGRHALLVTALGGLAMLFGMVLLGQSANTYTISEILTKPGLAQSATFPLALGLILIGAFTKSAQFPFHFWLPGAMAAPTPASAYLHAATMVKAGVYLLARLYPVLSVSPIWFWSLFIFGGITMLLGAVSAMRYTDLKRLLAYATVSQLGILVLLLAFHSDVAYAAVIVGILAHALYKGPLFLVAGIVDHATGTRDLQRLGNLWRKLPWVTVTAALAALSMAGFPLLLGFLAKENLLETLYDYANSVSAQIGWPIIILAAVTGAFFTGYSLTFLWDGFLRKRSPAESPIVGHAPAFSFVFGPLALALLSTLIPFLIGQVAKPLLSPPASSIAGRAIEVHLALWHGWTPILITSLCRARRRPCNLLGTTAHTRRSQSSPHSFQRRPHFNPRFTVYMTLQSGRRVLCKEVRWPAKPASFWGLPSSF